VPTPLEPEVTLPWLARLRWLSIAAQAIALAVGWYLDSLDHPALALAALLAGAVSNAALQAGLHRRTRWSPASLTGAILSLDIALLTLVLAGTGGASNPFTVLYLVHITLSAVVLSSWWTAAIALGSVAGFGLLFLLPAGGGIMNEHVRMGHVPGGPAFSHHLRGMWIAFVVATALTAYFVSQITRAIAAQREQIARLREAGARSARLAALTTLAAGAAHELNNPLGTIAIASHEALLALAAEQPAPTIRADLELIELEVERCQLILGQMAARAGDGGGEVSLSLADLCERVRAHLGDDRSARIGFTPAVPPGSVRVPPGPMIQSLAALVGNALDASDRDQAIEVAVAERGEHLEIAVIDRGTGIAPEHAARIGEPFFTTKQPGRGLGLGVFLARAFVESRGGQLSIESRPSHGTRAVMRLPRERAP
jgi:two-component system, sensor histidine kinase RegB